LEWGAAIDAPAGNPPKNRAETFPGSNEFLVVLMVRNQTRSLHLKMEKAATEFPAINFSHRNK
jgi:hypothetical protein